MTTRFAAVLIVTIVAGTAVAAPERDALERKAAAALDELRYEEAYPLYEQLERTGANDLGQTRMMYRRLAEIAASVRQSELAIGRFQKLLAIEPAFELEPGAPKLFHDALAAARARTGPLAPLDVTLVKAAGGRELGVVVSRDALHLVGGASVFREGEPGAIASAKGASNLRLVLPPLPATKLRVIVEDAFGNQLIELPAIETAAIAEPRVGGEPPARSERRWYGRPVVWLGVAGGIAAGVGVALGSTVRDRQAELDAILDNSRNHTRAEAEAALDRLERRALHANIAFVAAGALVTGALIAFVLEPDDEKRRRNAAITVTARGDGAVLGVTRSF